MKRHCCRSSYSFRITMPTKGIIAIWASYPFTGSILHTVSLPTLWDAQSNSQCQKYTCFTLTLEPGTLSVPTPCRRASNCQIKQNVRVIITHRSLFAGTFISSGFGRKRALRPTQPPIQWMAGVISLGQSAAGAWSWSLTPSSAEIKNE
jgi:hypothetical protein